jgi:hypothetical protein
MKVIMKISPLLFLALLAGIVFWHFSGGINDLAFGILTMVTIAIATIIGVYRFKNKQQSKRSKVSYNER